jgi:WD40 repeat protein
LTGGLVSSISGISHDKNSGFLMSDPNESKVYPDPKGTPQIIVQYDQNKWNVRDVRSGDQLGRWPLFYHPARICPSSKLLATREGDYDDESSTLPDWVEEYFPRFAKWKNDKRTLRLWDLATHAQLAKLDGYSGDCLFSANGQTFVAQSKFADQTISVFDLPPRKPLLLIVAWSLVAPVLVVLWSCWRSARLARRTSRVAFTSVPETGCKSGKA